MRQKNSIFLFLLILFSGLILMSQAFQSMSGNRQGDECVVKKLPWPHQEPGSTPKQIESLLENLFITNNYGTYAASEDLSIAYLHDGLDIVLPNGTKLYAVESGYVKWIDEYLNIIIGDKPGSQPGNGWMYGHVTNLQIQEGDYVGQGDYIADVFFQGVPHVHLKRIFLERGSWRSYENINCTYPDKYFIYIDTEPPVIKAPFYYFQNNTDIMFQNTHPTVIYGDVDVVVAIRDPGEYARSEFYHYGGDWLGVARIEYRISNETGTLVHRQSFDFTKIIINIFEPNRIERVLTIYKFYGLFPSEDDDFWHYIITNTDGTGEFEKIDIAMQDYAWNTDSLDLSGKPLFPDGLYQVTVIAYDFMGNISTETDTVRVLNAVKKGKSRR